ncbi:V-set and immunoglobulin domain-containing protein 10-like 2 [Hypomesus transpacificus]|uniref:V-set and immunoglobulin domain-containing protein 10-like 2 n=1 Tax=Hypomesus transpacificus TaxID=137520 RepID=UPI001F080D0A|nr:V-set and immunoglobulin domain-containing protein 10-like 2 [Hypomesus transpacificus]
MVARGLTFICLLTCLFTSPGHAVDILDPGEVVYVDSRLDGVVGRAVILECGATLPDVYIWGFTKPGTDAIRAVVYDFGKGPKIQQLAQTLGDLQVISKSASVSIENLQLAARGLYTCQALYDTPQGAKLYYYYTHLFVLVPVTKPYILVSDASPAEGSSAWLRCGLENGTSPIYYEFEQETHNGFFKTFGQGNSSRFNMTEINRNHTGWYRCSVRNAVNQQRSDRIWLDIIYGPDIPQIDVTPYSVTERGYSALERETVSLLCQSQSNPPSQYVWFYNNSQVYTGPQFTITRILRMHTGIYACLAQNTYLNTRARKTITLTVYYPPDGSPSCIVQPALNYSSLSLQCTWPGGLPPPSLRWSPGLLAPGQEGAVLGQEGAVLTNNVTMLQSGANTFNNSLFTCQGSHLALNQSTYCSIRTLCFAYATRDNQQLMLSCSWGGGAPRALLWWEGPGGQQHGGGEENANILVLRSGSAQSGQAYICRGKHPLHPLPQPCTLMLEAPVLLTQRSMVSVYEGSDVELTCILTANYLPASDITWFNNRRQEVRNVPQKYLMQRGAAWANLTVRETDGIQDSGQYWCSASNAVGGAEIPITLLVKRYPMPPNVTLVRLVYSTRQRSEVQIEWRLEEEGQSVNEGARDGGFTRFMLERRSVEEEATTPGRKRSGEEEEEERGEGRSSSPSWLQVGEQGPDVRYHTLGNLIPTLTYQFRVTAVNHRTVGHPSPAKTPADPPFNAYPAVIGAAIGGMILAAIATVLLFMFIIRNRNNNPRLHDMLFGMQHSQSRENINFPEDEIMEGAEGGGDLGPSPGPDPVMSSPRASSPRAQSPLGVSPATGQPPPPGDDNEPVNVTITVMATGS